MWNLLKEYFSFTKKERTGIIFVVAIIIVLIILPHFFQYFIKSEIVDSQQFEKEIAQLKIDSSSKNSSKNYQEYSNDYTPSYKKELPIKKETFYFDPNTASVDDWIRLGIRKRTAETIQKYISKGGKFYKPEDIKKIYGLSATDVERLIPYVSIKNLKKDFSAKEEKSFAKENYSSKYAIQPFDINLADTSAYISLPGIGSKLSKRILAFREKLGGFYSVEQVGETYFLPDSTFQKIKKYLFVKDPFIKKININASSVDVMKAHPYINYNVANAIFQYRQQHGDYKSVQEIKKIMTITDDVYNKAAPYLTTE